MGLYMDYISGNRMAQGKAKKAPQPMQQHRPGQEQTRYSRASTEDSIPLPPVGRKSKGGIFLEIKIKFPGGGEIKIERKPMDSRKFDAVCRLLALGLYVALTRVIASTGDFFALLWFYLLTAGAIGGWIFYKSQSAE